MTATTPPPPEPGRPRRWPRWLARGLFALLFVGVPLLGLASFAALWVRSYHIQEIARAYHRSADPALAVGAVPRTSWGFAAETDASLLGLSVYRASCGPLGHFLPEFAGPDEGEEPGGWGVAGNWLWYRMDQGEELRGRNEMTSRPDRMPGPVDATRLEEGCQVGPAHFVSRETPNGRALDWPNTRARSFEWGGELTGGTVAHWSYVLDFQSRLNPQVWADHATIIAPFWAWMVPGLIPIIGWCWCPPGRCLPRLTLRRTLGATAALGVYLGALLQVPDADRAVLALRQFYGQWLVGPAPDGSGRLVVGALMMFNDGEFWVDLTTEQIAPIRPALARLADLRVLSLADFHLGCADLAEILPDALPGLESLDLNTSSATDATLVQVGRYGNLRQLLLGTTEVTDAGLAYLRGLTRLEDLALENLPLTDVGLAHLRGLPRLRRLSFHQTGNPNPFGAPRGPKQTPSFSEDALRRLADSLPALEELICPDGTVLRPGRPAASSVPPEARP